MERNLRTLGFPCEIKWHSNYRLLQCIKDFEGRQRGFLFIVAIIQIRVFWKRLVSCTPLSNESLYVELLVHIDGEEGITAG